MGFSYFFSAEFIRWPRSLGTLEGLLEPSGTIWNAPWRYWNCAQRSYCMESNEDDEETQASFGRFLDDNFKLPISAYAPGCLPKVEIKERLL